MLITPKKLQTPFWSIQEVEQRFALTKAPTSSVKNVIDFSAKCFNDDSFEVLYDRLRPEHILVLDRSYLIEKQLGRLFVLANSNSMKGLKLIDPKGQALGSAYTDWSSYSQAKKNAAEWGMRETVARALEYFTDIKQPPQYIIDFGAGTGQDTVALFKEPSLASTSFTAVDGETEALEVLKSKLSSEEKSRLACHTGAFINFCPIQKADLLISSLTWAYRPPADFGAVWQHTIDVVKEGGLIAGHFFGPKKNPDSAMTYHTEEEVRALLEKDFEITWLNTEPPGTCWKIYGGDGTAWGSLIHIVARKKCKI